jgi:hypothetical protein
LQARIIMPNLTLRSNTGLTQADKELKLFNYMVLGAYALMAQIATNLYFTVEVEFGPSRMVDLANFVARRPFQYRVLVPGIVHLAARLAHASQFQYYPLYQYIEIAAVFATLIAFRGYLSQFMAASRAALVAPSLLAPMALIHICVSTTQYPSDTPAILFFVLGLTAIQKRAYLWLYAILGVATINRESSALLVVALAATMLGQVPNRRYLAHLAGLSFVWCAIKLAIDQIFANNPGMVLEDHTPHNRGLVLAILHGELSVLIPAILLCAIPAVLVVGRNLIPSFLLRLLVIVPFYAAVMWQVGILDEYRAWNEAVPTVWAPLVVLFCALADRFAASHAEASTDNHAPDGGFRRVSASP